jgi:hypothetical protein
MLESFDKGRQINIAILDFSKVFDTIPHERRLHKIDQYGIRGKTHKRFENLLIKHKMRVRLKGVLSEEASVDAGIYSSFAI